MAIERLRAVLAPEPMGEGDDTIGLVIYTGAVVDRWDPYTGESYTLALDVSPDAVDTARVDQGTAPLLDSHEGYSTDSVLGVIVAGSVTFEDGAVKARARLSVDEEKAGKIADIRAGILRAVSVGADILESKETGGKGATRRHVQATRWAIAEASIVAIGADPAAQTFSRQQPQGEGEMGDTVDLSAVRADAARLERERIAGIELAGKTTRATAARIAELRDSGVELAAAREALINEAAARDAATPVTPQVAILRDAGDTAIEQAKHALLAKAVPQNIEAKIDGKTSLLWDGEKAGSLRNSRVVDIFRTMLGATGQLRDGMNDREVVRRALLAHSSSNLPDLLGDSVGKALLYGYQTQERQYEKFCKRVQTPGLHARKPVIVSGASAVGEMAEGAPYPQQTIGDTAESYSAKKYGGSVAITLEALLRDDLDALSQIPTGLSNGLVIKQNAIVAALFASGGGYGPTLAADSVALFNSAHANLVDNGSGGAPTMARFAALRVLLAKMEDAQGNLQPRQLRYIVVPAELFHIAEALLQGQAMPSALGAETRPPSLSRLEVLPFDYLTSATKWYGFADPMLSPAIEVATPNNMPEVWAESEIDFSTDARVVKAGMYFAAAAVDFRGVAMNFGA